MLRSIAILVLLSTTTAFAATLNCENDPQDKGGYLIVEYSESRDYFNGSIRLVGNALNSYFQDSLGQMKDLQCGQYFQTQCSFKARVNPNFSAQRSGRYEPGFEVFQDGTGMKLISLFDGKPTGKNWYFNNCRTRK